MFEDDRDAAPPPPSSPEPQPAPAADAHRTIPPSPDRFGPPPRPATPPHAAGYAAPRPIAAMRQPGEDATGGLIPYNNVPALVAYYLGLFSLFPVVGFFLAVPAFVLGVIGLKKRKANPAIRGSVHAWIGIVMGGLFTVIWGLVGLLIIVAIVGGIANA